MKKFSGGIILLSTILLIIFLFEFSDNEIWESRVIVEEKEEILSVSEIIRLTNVEREKEGFVPLQENALLRRVAEIKLNDMITNQYFEHRSPDGKEAGDLAFSVGYDFIATGENLAMGNFINDKILIEGWMESPEHRENILHHGYREIGVALKKAAYEERETWLVVQIFGLPSWICPDPNKDLLTDLKSKQEEADILAREIESLKREIEASSRQDNEKVSQYNILVSRYNRLAEEIRAMVSKYNEQVDFLNQCINSYGF